jgi:hypothetical protein
MEKNKIILRACFEEIENIYWQFGLDCCGVLSFFGEVNPVSENELDGQMCLVGSPFFTPSWYGYLPENLSASFEIYFSETKDYSAKLIGYLTHIGPILLAMKRKDYFLATQLLARRFETYLAFSEITKYILKEGAFSAYLTWKYGIFEDSSYSNKVVGFLTEILGSDYQKIFGLHSGCAESSIGKFLHQEGTILSFPLVGADYQEFISVYDSLKKCEEIELEKALVRGQVMPNRRGKFFENLNVKVQAEPYNIHDPNALGVYIQDPRTPKSSKALLKAGYMRATLASIIRQAYCNNFSFTGKLIRIGGTGYNAKRSLIVQIEIPKDCG